MSEIIYLSNVRLSFPHLAEPQRQVNEATGKERISYNCEFIMPQDHDGFIQFMQRYGAMALEKWKEHAQTVMGMIQNDRKLRCFGRGEEKINKKTFQPYDGYAGHVFITSGRDSPPQMIQADGSTCRPDQHDGLPAACPQDVRWMSCQRRHQAVAAREQAWSRGSVRLGCYPVRWRRHTLR
jgi:hypothetical protein